MAARSWVAELPSPSAPDCACPSHSTHAALPCSVLSLVKPQFHKNSKIWEDTEDHIKLKYSLIIVKWTPCVLTSQAEKENTASHPDVPSFPLPAKGKHALALTWSPFPLFSMVFFTQVRILTHLTSVVCFCEIWGLLLLLSQLFVLENFRLAEKLPGFKMNTNMPFT